jgi:hypothetical protein
VLNAAVKLFSQPETLLKSQIRSKSVAKMPILHMTAGDWARCLDTQYVPATIFDDAVDLCRQKLDLAPLKTPAPFEERGNVVKQTPHQGCLFSPGDRRVWHRKAGVWVGKLRDATYESPGYNAVPQEPDGVNHSQTELVEALIGHGLLRDDDLNLLAAESPSADDGELCSSSSSTSPPSLLEILGIPTSVVEDESETPYKTATEDIMDMFFDGSAIYVPWEDDVDGYKI